MYNKGDLHITDPPCPDTVGNCEDWPNYGHDHMVHDNRSGLEFFENTVYLPHSCEEWVIGGPEQIAAMIEDLTAALKATQEAKR